MPATLLSHQAIILPLKMRWPRYFSGLGLCLGSMAPDLEFIGRLSDDWLFSHTLGAQLWFTVPVTLLLTWVVTALLLPSLLPYVRDHPDLRLHDLAAIDRPRTAAQWGVVAYSAWLGGCSHVLLDGITHGNHSGWLVPWLPVLRTLVPHFGDMVPLHDALQFWLTILFALASVLMWRRIAQRRLLWQWRARTVAGLPRQPRRDGYRVLAMLFVCALIGAAVGLRQVVDSPKALAAAVAFGAIDLALLGSVLLAARLRPVTT